MWPSNFSSQKILWNSLGMVFVIPRKKVLLSRNSMCLGIAHPQVRNRTEQNSVKNSQNKKNRKTFHRSKASCFGTSFQKFFLLSGRNKIPIFFSSVKWLGTEFWAFLSSAERFGLKLRSSACFSLLRNGSERNSDRFSFRGTDGISMKRIKITSVPCCAE